MENLKFSHIFGRNIKRGNHSKSVGGSLKVKHSITVKLIDAHLALYQKNKKHMFKQKSIHKCPKQHYSK